MFSARPLMSLKPCYHDDNDAQERGEEFPRLLHITAKNGEAALVMICDKNFSERSERSNVILGAAKDLVSGFFIALRMAASPYLWMASFVCGNSFSVVITVAGYIFLCYNMVTKQKKNRLDS